MPNFIKLIKQNTATNGALRIGIYDKKGNRVGYIPLGGLSHKNWGRKIYSFGALSDLHISQPTAVDDTKNAIRYLNKREDVDFICICGDITHNGYESQFKTYKEILNECSDCTPVFPITGNHEYYDIRGINFWEKYTGFPLVYSFEHKNDVFIMIGCYSFSENGQFTEETIKKVETLLESNKNKRCFLFVHCFPPNDCGNAGGLYLTRVPDIFGDNGYGGVFKELLKHYKNTTLFHGHSHLKFYLQEIDEKANYNESLGYRSIHIPSISVPRDYTGDNLPTVYAESEGYVVDVYEGGIHLKGRDFKENRYLPVSSYWIETPIVDMN